MIKDQECSGVDLRGGCGRKGKMMITSQRGDEAVMARCKRSRKVIKDGQAELVQPSHKVEYAVAAAVRWHAGCQAEGRSSGG